MAPGESDSTNTWLPAERRAVGVIALIGVLRMFGLFALLPVLALHAATLEGATPLLIGMAVGAYGLTQAGLQIPLGALSDRIGRLPVIVAGLAVFAAGSVLAAYSDTVWGVIAGRLLQGAGAISATLTALIADATREGVRTRSMAVFGVGVGGAFMLAMIVGPKFSGHFGVPALFLFAAFLALVAAVLLIALPGDIPRPEAPRRWNFRPAFRADLLRLDFYVFLLHAILTASFVALPFLFVDRLELPVTEHWKMYVGALLLSLAGTVPLVIRDERQGKRSTVGLAVSLMLLGLLVLTFAGFGIAPVFGGLVLFFAGFNFLEAGLPARLSLVADDESRGASLGLFASSQFLGAFVGGLIGGRFLATGRPADVFFVCVLLAGIWLAMQSFGRLRST
jgi:MFS family permease